MFPARVPQQADNSTLPYNDLLQALLCDIALEMLEILITSSQVGDHWYIIFGLVIFCFELTIHN